MAKNSTSPRQSEIKPLDISDDISGSIIGNTAVAVGGSVFDRLMSKIVKTPLEKAQEKNAETARLNFIERQRQFEVRMREERLRQEDDQLHREKMFFADVKSKEKAGEVEHSYRRWPLDNLPHEIRAELRAYADHGINLIVCTTSSKIFMPELSTSQNEEDRFLAGLLRQTYIADLFELNRWLSTIYGKTSDPCPILPYIAAEDPNRQAYKSPQSLSAALRYFLSSEPCILVHLDIEDLKKASVYVEIWGLSPTARDLPTTQDELLNGSPRSNSPSNVSAYEILELRGETSEDLAEQRMRFLKSLVASLIDFSRTIKALDQNDPPTLHGPEIILSQTQEVDQAAAEILPRYLELFSLLWSDNARKALTVVVTFTKTLEKFGAIEAARQALKFSVCIFSGRPQFQPEICLFPMPRPMKEFSGEPKIFDQLVQLRDRLVQGENPRGEETQEEATNGKLDKLSSKLGGGLQKK